MTYKETFRMNQRDFDEVLEDNINEAAQCLLGIANDWGYFEIEQFLDWQLDNLDELPEGYPKEVMTREYESLILEEVERLLKE
jgi:hypothetical protein